jgi:hypothetical protein
MRGLPASLLLLAACARGAAGWGAPGHMVTAALAERHLSSGAAAAASADLGTFRGLYPTESDFVTAADWCEAMRARSVRANARA